MKAKKLKKIIVWISVILLILSVLLVVGYTAYKAYYVEKDIVTTEEKYSFLADEVENISYDIKTGLLYVNNEIIVLTKQSANKEDIQNIAKNYDAEIIDSDADTGIYLFRLQNASTSKSLERTAKKLKKNLLVEDAFINPVLESGSDDKDAVYPNDKWNGDDWSVDEPKGENWGAEAINAPGAWAYLDKLEKVNVGLIDTYVNTNLPDLKITTLLTKTDTTSNYYETVKKDVSKELAKDHGCHVAGTIGATWNNKIGISGIMGDKVNMYSSLARSFKTRKNKNIMDYYSAYDYVKAIKALVNNDVRAINISQNTGRLIGFSASRGNKKAIRLLETQADITERMLKRIINDIERNGGNDFVLCISAGNSNNITYYEDSKSVYGYVEKQGVRFWLKNESGNSEAKYNNFLALIDDPDVMDRIMVVGSVKRNVNVFGALKKQKYIYTDYSCIGDRVDIVAPGDDIYSLKNSGYAEMSGTSMAAPHVTAVAGLAFAANPSLSGPEVKAIVTAFSNGRYYHGSSYSGLVDAKEVVKYALSTKSDSSPSPISNKSSGLDLCFIIDTTGSMGDDIENAKENMLDILSKLSEKTPDYRVALVDYRDFSDRGSSEDYPAKVQLAFSKEDEDVVSAIESLTLGNGGDSNETVYSAIHESLKLKWRPRAQKIIIILGDAPPLDPEPNTDYTYDDVIKALYNADIGIDLNKSDSRVLGKPDDSAISVYSIGIDVHSTDFFANVAEDTGGKYTEVSNADEVSSAIIDSIEQIKIDAFEVKSKFGEEYSGETVNLYTEDNGYEFSFELDENGNFTLADMPSGNYDWEIERLAKGGEMHIGENNDNANIEHNKNKWYSFAFVIWYRHTVVFILSLTLAVLLLIFIIIFIRKLKKRIAEMKIRKQSVIAARSDATSDSFNVTSSIPDKTQGGFCDRCGTKINKSAVFCHNCGNTLKRK